MSGIDETEGGGLSEKFDIAAAVRDYWQLAAFIAGGILMFLAGKERQRFKVDQIGREVERQGERIKALEAQGNSEAVELAKIVATQSHILTRLDEIHGALKGKQDK